MDPGQTERADPGIDMVTDLVWLEHMSPRPQLGDNHTLTLKAQPRQDI